MAAIAYATICSCSLYSCSTTHGESISLLGSNRCCCFFSEGTSLTNELTHDTSGSKFSDRAPVLLLVFPLFLNPKEADFFSLFSSSPFMPQSSFPSGDLQSESAEETLDAVLEGVDCPKWWGDIAPRSIKLWLLFAKAADLEFITAAATAADESNPKPKEPLAGDEGRLVG